jgi:putative MATE family efflux protein
MIKKNNLTEGSVLRSLVTLSVPIIIAQLLHAAYQLTDTFWVGRLGADAIASVSISFPVIFLLISLGGGLTMAGSILVAQYKGRQNQPAVNYIAGQTLLAVFTVALFLSVMGYVVAPYLIRLMGVEPVVFSNAVAYLKISFIGIVFMFLFFVFQALMRGVGNVKMPMYIILGTVLLNLFLDPLFIFGWGIIPGLGVAGAALATITMQGLSAVAGLLILFRGRREIVISLKELRFDFSLIKKMFFLGLPASIEQSARSLGMIIMTFLVAGFGTVIVAAFGIGARMLSLVIIPSMGLSMATSTLVGQNMGAGKIDRTEKIVKVSAWAGFVSLAIAGLLMFLFAEFLCSFFVPGETETIQSGSLFIRLMALTFGFIALQMVMTGVFRGAGSTLVAMMLSVTILWILELPLAFILSRYTSLAELGLWIAFPVSNLVGAAVSVIWFLKGSWKKKRITEEIKILEKAVTEEVIMEEGLQ